MVERWAGHAATTAVLLAIVALQLHGIDDSDTWWHLASGLRIAQTGEIAAVDPFSFTAAGAEWLNRQWLFDLVLLHVWRVGEAGLAVLVTGALYAGGLLALLLRARRTMPAWAAAFLVLAAALAAVERYAVRPEAVSVFALGMVVLLVDRRIDAQVASALVILQVLWANCHAISVLGLVPVGAEVAGALAARWWPHAAARPDARSDAEVRWLAVALAGGVLAEAATPFGLAGALFPLRLLTVIRGHDVTSAAVVEHRATSFAELSPASSAGLVALLVLGGMALALSWRRVRPSTALSALGFAVLAFLARRNVALAGFGIVPLVADGLGPLLVRLGRRHAAVAVAGGAAVAVAAATLVARIASGRFYDDARLTRSFGIGESRLLFSAGAVDFLATAAPGARVFNDDLLGGWVLWRTQPPRPVFIDGRMQVYPPSLYEEYLAALSDAGAFASTAARWGIGAVLLHHPAPGRLELAAAIARLPGWRVAYLDPGAIVLLADGRAPALPAGVDGPLEDGASSGLAAGFERFARAVRVPHEEALAHYQRGRALLWLYGVAALGAARADFQHATRLVPDFAPAHDGLAAIARAAGAGSATTATGKP